MKILGISASPRNENTSTTYKLVKTVLDATETDYELVSLRGKFIKGCICCLGCVRENICTVKDDMTPLREMIIEADAYVIGAPNYYSSMNANLHALLERLYQFRHQDGDTLWGKLAIAVGVGGSNGNPVTEQIETFLSYNFIETVSKVSAQGAAACFTCGYGETCNVGAIAMMYGPGTKITEDIIPSLEKQPQVIETAKLAGQELKKRLQDHDRNATTQKMKQTLMQKFEETT
jgi:multimeric flavodoxin WrbA